MFLLYAQGQGVLSDKLRSFSMQDLTLINAEDELALHSSETRMRRDTMDEMSSGASTLPRAKSTAARQSKVTQHAPYIYIVPVEKHRAVHVDMHVLLCVSSLTGVWRVAQKTIVKAGLGLVGPSLVM